MIARKDFQRVQKSLRDYLRQRFEDAEVEVDENIHYKGVNIVVTSRAFDGLLAEQRFHHVVRAIPKDFYEKYLQRGLVWFELTPGESGQDLMKMRRSTDIAPRQEEIRKKLEKISFFSNFQAKFKSKPASASITEFKTTKQLLGEADLDPRAIEDACLFMILNGAYCDAHVLSDLIPKFVEKR